MSHRPFNIHKLPDTHKLLLKAKEELASAVDNMKHGALKTLEAASNEARKKAYDGRDTMEEYIKGHPFKSVGIAAVAGALAIFFLRK